MDIAGTLLGKAPSPNQIHTPQTDFLTLLATCAQQLATSSHCLDPMHKPNHLYPLLSALVLAWIAARILQRLYHIYHFISRPASNDTPNSSSSQISRRATPRFDAGFSCPQVQVDAETAHSWSTLGAHMFNVRVGPNYPRNGLKAPSKPSFGEVVASDTLRTKRKLHHLLHYNYIALPKPTPGWKESYPEFVVVNQMLPVRLKRTLVTSEFTDGETLNFITYIRMRPGIGEGWQGDTDPIGPDQLLRRFLLRADQDGAVAHCLKEIGKVLNFEEIEDRLPRAITNVLKRFNGKPILTRPEHKFYRDSENRYLQIDLDSHRYSLATRMTVDSILRFCHRLELAYGLVVEARREQELPENMMFSMKIKRLHPDRAVDFPPTESSRPIVNN